MVNDPLFEIVLQYVRGHQLVRSGQRLVVGVSGGPDSVCLLYLLHELRYELGIQLVVAHYDHALRPGSRKDAEHVRSLAEMLSLPFVSERDRYGKATKGSVEDIARKKRYAFFKKVVRSQKADAVLVAHTLDDQAETVLMRILRGTGTKGLRAIMPERVIDGVKVVRPLLAVPRVQIEAFIKAHKLSVVNDPTNVSDEFFRNRVRHKVLPLLSQESGQDVKRRLAILADVMAADQMFIEVEAWKKFGLLAKLKKGSIAFPLKKFNALPVALRRALVRMAVDKLRPVDLGFEHVHAVDALATKGPKVGELHLPCAIRVKKTTDALQVRKVSVKT